MTPDRQLVAFAGQSDGLIELVDLRQPPGQTNRILRQAGDFTRITFTVGDIMGYSLGAYEDALKLSGCINLDVWANRVEGGLEDVLDVNRRCKDCNINIRHAYPRGKFVTTQKGESDGISVFIESLHGHGSEVDFDYGNNGGELNGPTKSCDLVVLASDGPAVVRLLRYEGELMASGTAFRYAFPWPTPKWLHSLAVWFLNLVQ